MTLIYKIHVQCSSSYYKCYIFLITERIHVVMFYDICAEQTITTQSMIKKTLVKTLNDIDTTFNCVSL
jgi:hypothetical protein